jgi:DNA-binding MarR family transcriptional regulator
MNSPGIGLSAAEVLLLCSIKPRTMAELEELTGCTNGQLSKAVRMLTGSYYDNKAQRVVLRPLHLLDRDRDPNGRGHLIRLSAKGQELIDSAKLNGIVGFSVSQTTPKGGH